MISIHNYCAACSHSLSTLFTNCAVSEARRIDIRYLFAYAGFMFQGPSARKVFVVTCKRRRRDVPTGVKEFPFQSIAVGCPLCGEMRRYLPSEVLLGRPHHLVAKQARAVAG